MSLTALADNTAPPFKSGRLHEVVSRLQSVVERNRRRWKALLLMEAVGMATALPLAYLWLVFFLDGLFHLPVLGRVLGIVGLLCGLGWAGRYLWNQWQRISLSEDEVALAIERRTPGGVQNRLINAVQLARVGNHDLSEAVIEENYARLQEIQLEQATHLRPALIRVGLATALILFGIVFWAFAPAQFGNAAARLFMPFASIDPLYRTRLTVVPGNMEATTGEAAIEIHIEGERPSSLTILRQQQGKTTKETIDVPDGSEPVTHVFREVTHSFSYSIKGGDYSTDFYEVTVPQAITLSRVRIHLEYPAYSKLAAKTLDSSNADLEALQWTKGTATFVLSQSVEEASFVLDRQGKSETLAFQRSDDGREWTASIPFEEAASYRINAKSGSRTVRLGPFAVRVVKDQEPRLELKGLERNSEIAVDAVLPVTIHATDDLGLQKVGLFFRLPPTAAGTGSDREEDWKRILEWPTGEATAWNVEHELLVAALELVEGSKFELAVRAMDTAPSRHGRWVTGAIYDLTIGGEGIALQMQYEQILRTEQELKALIVAEQEMQRPLAEWLSKLDGGGLRWDDPKNVDALHAGVNEQVGQHKKLQVRASAIARSMVAASGNLRIAIGMLADTEMVRLQRILESVATRDTPMSKRSALLDGKVTLERIVRSLQELQEQYVSFRSEWELANMVPFTRILADRQLKMRDQSRHYLTPVSDKQETHARVSMLRRQEKMIAWCGLIRPAFEGMAERVKDLDPILSAAFAQASTSLGADSLLQPMRQAAEHARAGRWKETVAAQSIAAEQLGALHNRLRQAQQESAKRALALLKEKAKSDLEAQKELEKLAAGSADAFVKDYPSDFKVEDTVRIWEVAGKKRKDTDDKEQDFKNAPLVDVNRKSIELSKDSGVRQDTDTLKLGTVSEKTAVLKLPRDKEKNAVKPFIQEKFDDLVGKLLEDADELNKDYQSLNLSTNQNNNDPGEIGRNGGALNSTGAVAATGNKKPPTTEAGGVSRTGRQGARAYGMIADDVAFNRKGRDKALEGQEQIADQAGKLKMQKTDENQTDTSTGVGGKKIDSDDSHFSLHDAGKWKDDYLKRMDKPQAKNYIVERQGEKIDAKTAAQLRDLTSKQEQVIERLKAIKKELKNLYLPTEHLDELAAALEVNLDNLKDRPDAELFRLQLQTLDRLRGALRVFQSANTSFQPSLPRERSVRGRILDEPDRPAPPGYEDAVRQYYLKLATQ